MQPKQPTDQELFKTASDALNKLKTIEQDPKWEQFSDSPCLMLKMTTDNRVMSRGETKINMNIHVLFDKLSQEDSLKLINPQLKKSKYFTSALSMAVMLASTTCATQASGPSRTEIWLTWP